MDKIIVQVQSWELLSKLPSELEGFVLRIELEECGTRYCIFTYENKESYKSFSVIYDHATKEFLGKIVIGLMEYFDVNFIVSDLNILEKLLRGRLKNTLKDLAVFQRDKLDSIVVDKKILEWSYSKELPQNLFGFTLFIKPWEPVRIINGSYIILDYSDFSSESSLVIYYNIFRDEFFGEVRIRRTPQMTAVFDGNTLEALEENIRTHLKGVLEKMRIQLDQENLHKQE